MKTKKFKKTLRVVTTNLLVGTLAFSSAGIIGQQAALADPAAVNIPGLIEAENYTAATGYTTANIENQATASGGKDITNVVAGNSLSYLVDVATAGSYKVTMRYAASTANTKSWSIRDGSGNVLYTGDTPSTGGTTTWGTVSGYVDLQAGVNTITLFNDKNGYKIDSLQFDVYQVPAPTGTPTSGTYGSTVYVSLSDVVPNAQIFYTTDGSTPVVTVTNATYAPGNAATSLYFTPIPISTTTTINAIGTKYGASNSAVASISYTFDPASKAVQPTASKASGTYSGTQSVTLSTTTANAKIYYTTDGSTPATSETGTTKLYTAALSITSPSSTLKAIAVADSLNPSDVATYNYVINATAAAAPTADITTGANIASGAKLTLTSSSTGTKIYYTTDGSTPTTSSTLYTGKIPLTNSIAAGNTVTIKAIASGGAFTSSTAASFTYTIDPSLVLLTNEASIPAVVAEMTNQEKADMVSGGGSTSKLPGAAGAIKGVTRLGIPVTVNTDGPSGIRITALPSGVVDSQGNQTTRYATQWPNGSARASTWNTTLEEQLGTAFGKEIHYFGSDILLAPGMNLHRSALNGRNFEYFSEDPVLTGNIAAAEVNGIQSQGVGTTIKHFAANNQETNRSNGLTTVSKRGLREMELRSFEIAVKKSQPWAIMTSYNQINGISAASHYDLLTTVTRNEWGFKGYFMTDWGGQGNASYWPAQTGNNANSSNLKAGLDLSMSSGNAANVLTGLSSGFVSQADLDASVTRLLQFIIKTPTFKGDLPSTEPNIYAAQNDAIAFQASVESMVILKNNIVNNKSALPIANGNITVIGNASTNMVTGGAGSGSANIDKSKVLQLPAALNAAYTKGTVIDATTMGFPQVASVLAVGGLGGDAAMNEMSISDSQMNDLVKNTSSTVMTIKRGSAEGSDIGATKGAYYLSDAEQDLISKASAKSRAQGKPFIVVLNMGAPVEMESWKDKADAILFAWEPGSVLGRSVAAVLTGAANPSGKLSTTFPINVVGNASNGKPFQPAVDFGQTNAQGGEVYNEGIYSGYRYYDTFNVPVSYEFGYGKNYSTFEYSNLQLSSGYFNNASSILNATLDVKNTSSVSGKEVAQLYVGAPGKSMDKPVKELKAFAKTDVLAQNAKQTLNFSVDAKSLASYDEARDAWVVEPGQYVVYAAASSKDIRQVSTFIVLSEIVVEQAHNVLNPDKVMNVIKPAVTGKAITGYVSVNATTNAGQAPVLPSTVQAIYNDGTIPSVNVTWSSIDGLAYAKGGTFTVTGVVAGAAIQPTATITVNGTASNTTLKGAYLAGLSDTTYLTFNLNGATNVDAQDLTLSYDPAVFDYIDTTILGSSTFAHSPVVDPVAGTVRFLLANTTGNGNADGLSIKLKTKSTAAVGSSLVKVSGTISNGQGDVTSIPIGSKIITINPNILNNVAGYDVGDLGIVSHNYGAKVGDENWNSIKNADFNEDGVIGLFDLVNVATKILNN
ncbi:glycoside hydrolase family 3 N-terminal domain-containing protein [Paenibacillus planticolens]|uniref:Carbohydrate-binding protein n=1 Tax=Paenibacillus planticolens TaxID=2654976 RepID=A0ABX1ZW75_9BACL|nr:chitobiase/beta-hexosaminidase C-terminal domain-containing protein [Paenibacillus planticolens]NOV04232.1 carbohydrate-binding protein [Paenibacillus planticolens]